MNRVLLPALLLSTLAQAAPVDYAKQLQPLWEEHCTDCHSASDADADFAIDSFAALMKGGKTGVALVAGKADDSLLVKFLEGRSGKQGKNQFMPPGKRDHLTPEAIALVKQWINEGARGPAMSATPSDPLAKLTKVAPKTSTRPIHAVAVKGAILAVGRTGEIELRDATSDSLLRKLSGLAGKVSALAFSANGAMLYAAAGEPGVSGLAAEFNVADGKLLRLFSAHADALYALAVSPDGKRLATGGYDQKIVLWDLATGQPAATLKGHNGSVNALAFRPDGKVLASASADRTVKLWDVAKAARLDTFSQPVKEQQTLAFTLDGKQLLAAGADSRLRVWSISADAKEGSNPLQTSKFIHEGSVLSIALSADGKTLATSAADKALKLWNASDLALIRVLDPQPDWAPAVAWLNASTVVTGRLDGSLARQPITPPAKMAANPKAKAKTKPAPVEKLALTRVAPPAFQIGASTKVQLTGTKLADIREVKFSSPEIKGSVQGTGLTITAAASVTRGIVEVSVVTAEGESNKLKLHADDLPLRSLSKDAVASPSIVWSTLTTTGQRDVIPFTAKQGETIVLDLIAANVGSKANTLTLEVLDASGRALMSNRGLDSESDPFIAFTAPSTGTFQARVHQLTLDGSADHFYGLVIAALPYATGFSPLSVTANSSSEVQLVGHNLKSAKASVKAPATGTAALMLDKAVRTRTPLSARVSALPQVTEKDGNDQPAQAQKLTLPASVHGSFTSGPQPDADCFAITCTKGEEWIIETLADKAGSPADTRVEVLTVAGQPVPQVRLQAVRDTAVTFRSVDGDNPDIRLVNWEEMDLNEYVYFGGDVMRIFRQPRGPDSGTLHFAIGGKRLAYFDTTAVNHAIDEPGYIVQPLADGAPLVPNGLPLFELPFANDDASDRQLGRDSRLRFVAPATASYVVRVTDSRGEGSDRSVYQIDIRRAAPGFEASLSGFGQSVPAGSSLGYSVRLKRTDYFDGEVTLRFEGVPAGWFVSSPMVVQAGHRLASGTIHASASAAKTADWSKFKATATAMIAGKEVVQPPPAIAAPTLGDAPPFIAFLEADQDGKPSARSGAEPATLTLIPGRITKAWLRVQRNKGNELISFDLHSLPHGVIVNDIGLSGVQIRAGETEREIELLCARWVPAQQRLAHACVTSARAEADSAGLTTSFPVKIVVAAPSMASAR